MASAFTLAGFQTFDVSMTDLLGGHSLEGYRYSNSFFRIQNFKLGRTISRSEKNYSNIFEKDFFALFSKQKFI